MGSFAQPDFLTTAEADAAIASVALRLGPLAEAEIAEAAALSHQFEQTTGRLAILHSMLSAEAAAGALGERARQIAATLTQANAAALQTRRAFLVEQSRTARALAALGRPASRIDLAIPYRTALEGFLAAIEALEALVLALGPAIERPLRRTSETLAHLGVRIILGSDDIGGETVARVGVYGRRLRELATLFGQLAEAVERYQQTLLGTLTALKRELGKVTTQHAPAPELTRSASMPPREGQATLAQAMAPPPNSAEQDT